MEQPTLRADVFAALKAMAPELDPEQIRADQALRPQIDLDSMDWPNVMLELHRRLQVDIPEADYGKLGTVDGIVTYLADRLAKAR